MMACFHLFFLNQGLNKALRDNVGRHYFLGGWALGGVPLEFP